MPVPRRLLSAWLGALLAFVVGHLIGVRRAHVLESLRRAGVAQPVRVAARMYRSLGTGVFELVGMALRPERRPVVAGLDAALAEVQGELERQSERGPGVVVATAHTGNWDLVACALATRVPLTIITKRLSVRWLNGWWQGLRAARGVRLVEAGRAAAEARRELGRGGWVVSMIDQAPERLRGTTAVEFLGATADVDLAPALLAARARCPLLVAFALRGPDGHRVRVSEILYPPPNARRAWAEEAMRRATRCLERLVLAEPEQWLWMHRRWKRAGAPTPGLDAKLARGG